MLQFIIFRIINLLFWNYLNDKVDTSGNSTELQLNLVPLH